MWTLMEGLPTLVLISTVIIGLLFIASLNTTTQWTGFKVVPAILVVLYLAIAAYAWVYRTSESTPTASPSQQKVPPGLPMPTEDSFQINLDTTIRNLHRDWSGFVATYNDVDRVHGRFVSPVHAILCIRITNMQKIPAMIENISAEAKTGGGRWVKLLRMDSRKVTLYSPGGDPNLKRTLGISGAYFERIYGGIDLQPGQTARGILLFAYPETVIPTEEVLPIYRIRVTDSVGHFQEAEKEASSGRESLIICMLKTADQPTDLSKFIKRYYDQAIDIRLN